MYVCLSDDYGCEHSPLMYMGMLLMQVQMRIWVSAILFQLELEQNGSPRSARIVRTLVGSGMVHSLEYDQIRGDKWVNFLVLLLRMLSVAVSQCICRKVSIIQRTLCRDPRYKGMGCAHVRTYTCMCTKKA